ncbi:hydroxyacid dehydrogenase [Arthrobacter sp. AQ5-05]|uniref:virulence RhuM family protein n=1 Tax=Arthrobacter sp. AQ5-05 TaxID=2184581 RepID=UPI000DCE1DC7|nr:virulence RhuM family protein [Arthrobacter sp. AQ5-05]RAX50309.1 hydroxyacid dehydrogenase [Arthrobacter sp. AQ5-05]
MTDSIGEVILYTTDDGLAHVQLHAIGGTAWLAQREIAELFQVSPQAITQHIAAVYSEGELLEAATCNDYLQVRSEGGRDVRRSVKRYSLDVILAVGFRVRSPRGTQFRRWATTVLAEYLVKGFAMDDAKLKGAEQWNYFDEWLERIRDIRASEKRFYQKVRDLYMTAVDYDPTTDEAKLFFAKVQNKMLWAVTGKTAAELVKDRSDADAPNMGLTNWEGSIVRKGDVATGKNYLSQGEVDELNRVVTMYLDYAEDQAKRRQTVTMEQWSEKLDAFLEFNGRELLTNAGSVSAAVAKKLAAERYDEFDAKRKATAAIAADEADIAELERLVSPRKDD